MKKRPIHQNLNTSFVSVGALVRYLRDLQFVGSIRLEFASYEAEIVFTEKKTIRAREYDHISGQISHGEHALEQILIRSKEPHGRIHVLRATEGYAGREDGSVFVDKVIVKRARHMAASAGGGVGRSIDENEVVLTGRDAENALILASISEFLRIIDDALAAGRLSFAAAFRLACDGIAAEFPFLRERRDALVYRKGEITVNVEAEIEEVAEAVFAALHPIYDRLRSEPKYSEIVRVSSDRLIELATSRRSQLQRFGIIHHVERLLAA